MKDYILKEFIKNKDKKQKIENILNRNIHLHQTNANRCLI